MWKVSKGLFVIILAPMLLVGLGMIFFGYTAPPEALTDDGYPLKEFLYFMGASFIIFPLLGTAGVFLYYKRINDRETYLLENGIQGEAEILQREQTGTYINELPQVKFLLLLTTPDREPYQLEYKDVVSLLDMNIIQVGTKLPVMVDPDNEKNILLIYN